MPAQSYPVTRAVVTVCAIGLIIVSGLVGARSNGSGKSGAVPAETIVNITPGLKYDPARIIINAGETVTWHNSSSCVSTVTADPASARRGQDVVLPLKAEPFNSGTIAPGKVFRHTFTVPGRYRYFCIPHEAAGMIGEIVVKPAR